MKGEKENHFGHVSECNFFIGCYLTGCYPGERNKNKNIIVYGELMRVTKG